MTEPKQFHVGIKAIIRDGEGKLLLVDLGKEAKSAQTWTLAGGRLNDGENIKDAVVRELKEELNWDVDQSVVGEVLNATVMPFNLNDKGLGLFLVFVEVKISPELFSKITISNEHIGYQFFTLKEMEERGLISPEILPILKKIG
jgi:8-oxo-dGTP pyrophosphatase MutT (NUDIX family)